MNSFLQNVSAINDCVRGNAKVLGLLGIFFFGVYLTYPITRSITESIFIHEAGAENLPKAWLISIFVLFTTVFLFNVASKKLSFKGLLLGSLFFSVLGFFGLSASYESGNVVGSYFLFILKEVYIILFVHLGLAYFNQIVSTSEAKILYGPLGAIGSVGGILGGLLSVALVKHLGSILALQVGVGILILFSMSFLLLDNKKADFQKEEKKAPPFKSLGEVKGYVLCIALVVMLSQFCINLAQFDFSKLFEITFKGDLNKQSHFLGYLYSCLGGLTFFIQLVVMPFVLQRFKLRSIHYFIPVLFLGVSIIVALFGSQSLYLVAAGFLIFKAVDYSLFSSVKEILYFALNDAQKAGAKYVTDMIVYRASKAGIAVFLIYFQNIYIIKILLVCFLLLWLGNVYNIFRISTKKMNVKEIE